MYMYTVYILGIRRYTKTPSGRHTSLGTTQQSQVSPQPISIWSFTAKYVVDSVQSLSETKNILTGSVDADALSETYVIHLVKPRIIRLIYSLETANFPIKVNKAFVVRQK